MGHGTEHLAVAVTPTGVVPGLHQTQGGSGGLGQWLTALPMMLVEQFELEGPKEALDDGVVKAVADRSHRSEQARTPEASAEAPDV